MLVCGRVVFEEVRVVEVIPAAARTKDTYHEERAYKPKTDVN